MAGYREHISVSGLLGVGYGVAAVFLGGFTPVQGCLAACLTWLAGMLPDVDSESGRPIRELFGLLSATVPMVMMPRLLEWGGNVEGAMALAIATYFAVRYAAPFVVRKLSVHRGMFHSLPAMAIAAETVFLAYRSPETSVRWLMAGGVAAGFLSHLVLDELYSVEWTGVRIRLNKFAGSAVKLSGESLPANAFAYALLFVLTYALLVNVGTLAPPGSITPFDRQALEQPPRFR